MVNIPIKPKCDPHGMFARKCPACGRYFKMKLGTGLPDQAECHCPHCNHFASHAKFWARSLGGRSSPAAPPEGSEAGGGIMIEIRARGEPDPIAAYPEDDLKEEVRCESCGLEYSVYEVFAHCPDCGIRHSKQILNANLSLLRRILKIAEREPDDLQDRLARHCLDHAISAFDGYGRCFFPGAGNLSFTEIEAARDELFNSRKVDIAASISSRDWAFVVNQFDVRDLIVRKRGVIDTDYAKKARIPTASVGRSVRISTEDVVRLMAILEKITASFAVG